MSSYRYMRINSSGQPKIAKGVWYQSEIPPPVVLELEGFCSSLKEFQNWLILCMKLAF